MNTKDKYIQKLEELNKLLRGPRYQEVWSKCLHLESELSRLKAEMEEQDANQTSQNDMDVETWDNMTVAERLHYKGLIVDRQVTDEEIEEYANIGSNDRKNDFTPSARKFIAGVIFGAKAMRDGQIS